MGVVKGKGWQRDVACNGHLPMVAQARARRRCFYASFLTSLEPPRWMLIIKSLRVVSLVHGRLGNGILDRMNGMNRVEDQGLREKMIGASVSKRCLEATWRCLRLCAGEGRGLPN